MCIQQSQHMTLVYLKKTFHFEPQIFSEVWGTPICDFEGCNSTHMSLIYLQLSKFTVHLDGFWCSSTPLRFLKSFCNPPLILTAKGDISPRLCMLCTMQSFIPCDTFFFKGVWHLWKHVLMLEGESSGSWGRWSPFFPVVRDAKGLFVSCPIFRGVSMWKPQMTTSFGWAKVSVLSCNCSHSNWWSPSPSCKQHLHKAAPTAHMAPYSGWLMGHDLSMLTASVTIDQSSTEWWALTLMKSSGGTFNMAVWQDGARLLPSVLLQNCSF